MNKTYSSKFNRAVYEIYAGEYYVTKQQQVVLTTLLGSCVSVCMRDKKRGVAGINHIMLSSTTRPEEMLVNKDARYGIHAMELMINKMMKNGARRKNLEAKVFGGARVLKSSSQNLAYANVDFAVSYLEMEEIPILARDTGGEEGRKIHFFPDDFTVYLKRIRMEKKLEKTRRREENYLQKLSKGEKQKKNLDLFE